MSKSTVNFWLLFIFSIVLTVIVISLFVKALKVIFYVMIVLALAPIIYLVLRLALPGRKSKQDKLKTRE